MKNAATSEIQNAIDDSMGFDRIVHLEWSQAREDALLVVSDDHVDAGDRVEFWADSDEQGNDEMSWRIHLDRN
jgi:hypothetical protein